MCKNTLFWVLNHKKGVIQPLIWGCTTAYFGLNECLGYVFLQIIRKKVPKKFGIKPNIL